MRLAANSASPAPAGSRVSGGYIEGVPPVPIPNTEVKPFRADGTARFPCGRVGRCRNIIETPRRPIPGPRGVVVSGDATPGLAGRARMVEPPVMIPSAIVERL